MIRVDQTFFRRGIEHSAVVKFTTVRIGIGATSKGPAPRNLSHERSSGSVTKWSPPKESIRLPGQAACACSFSLISRASPKAYTRSPQDDVQTLTHLSFHGRYVPLCQIRQTTDRCDRSPPARRHPRYRTARPVITQLSLSNWKFIVRIPICKPVNYRFGSIRPSFGAV